MRSFLLATVMALSLPGLAWSGGFKISGLEIVPKAGGGTCMEAAYDSLDALRNVMNIDRISRGNSAVAAIALGASSRDAVILCDAVSGGQRGILIVHFLTSDEVPAVDRIIAEVKKYWGYYLNE